MATTTSPAPQSAAAVKKTKEQQRPARTMSPLTGIQERICDQIADLLVNGGSQNNLHRLVTVALDHQWRKVAIDLSVGERESVDAWTAKLVGRDIREWLDELAAARVANRHAPQEERMEPANVSERIRLRNIERCQGLMDEFLIGAHPEEIALLIEVLSNWESASLSMSSGYAEITLAGAFESELGKDRHYVKVPEKLVNHLEGYVQALVGRKTFPSLQGVN